jgi:hypothetical protein
MKRQFILILAAIFARGLTASGQTSPGPPTPPPRDVVERLWAMATRGELLTSEGWERASALFTVPQPRPFNKPLFVVSNYYGINVASVKDNRAEVQMEYTDCGRIDSALRYSAPQNAQTYKTSFGYHLVLVPTYLMMYGSDGKTLVEKKPTGGTTWQIHGPQTEGPPPMPWTTVNTAIRYVLETRDKTTDPTIRKNADRTLAILMTMH